MRKITQLFVAGPPIVKFATGEDLSKEELGGTELCGSNGTIDNVVGSEQEAFLAIRKFLSFLPSHSDLLPPKSESDDSPERREEELLNIVPNKEDKRPFEVRKVIELIADKKSFFEVGDSWGNTAVVGFARMNGHTVGIVANNGSVMGGVLTAKSSQKIKRHVDLCSVFNVPIVLLVDTAGIAVGKTAEEESTIKFATSCLVALFNCKSPSFTVILRKVYGVGGAAMVDFATNFRVSWPSGDWGR